MIEKIANRQYEMLEFPYFVPKKELDYNIEYAKSIIDGDWVRKNWEEQTKHGGKHKFLKRSFFFISNSSYIFNHGDGLE